MSGTKKMPDIRAGSKPRQSRTSARNGRRPKSLWRVVRTRLIQAMAAPTAGCSPPLILPVKSIFVLREFG
jgi:hypothetical protein